MIEFQKNNFTLVDNGDIHVKFRISFDAQNNVHISNLVPYCAKHGAPIKMIEDFSTEKIKCSVPNCKVTIDNPRFSIDTPMHRLKNILHSDLEKEWKEINN